MRRDKNIAFKTMRVFKFFSMVVDKPLPHTEEVAFLCGGFQLLLLYLTRGRTVQLYFHLLFQVLVIILKYGDHLRTGEFGREIAAF